MHFDIIHELAAPLHLVERAVLDAGLAPRLAAKIEERLAMIESVTLRELEPSPSGFTRVLEFQAAAPLGLFRGSPVAREAMFWAEHWAYDLSAHEASWEVRPKAEYRRYFDGRGTYRLEPIDAERTRRVVAGQLAVHAPLIGAVVARMAVVEIRKTYDAEAEALRQLAEEAIAS